MAKKPVKYYVVDAFTDSAFKGNPAAVCLLEEDRDDQWLQAVAAEFNLSETCYLTRSKGFSSHTPRFSLRWFTPVTEVELCGHATLASAYILFTTGLIQGGEEHQNCFSVELDFPIVPYTEFDSTEVSAISKALNGAAVIDIKRTPDGLLLVVLPSAKSVIELQPQIDDIRKCGGEGLIASGAASTESGFDFASRCFFPKCGINEDPVTGGAHCTLAPYWSQKLGKCDFIAYQASARGGILGLHLDEKNQRVLMRGKAVTVMEGTLLV